MSCVDSEDSDNLGHSTEDIVRKYEHLTPAGVHAALAYYFAKLATNDSEIAADEAEAEKIEKEFLNRQQSRCVPQRRLMERLNLKPTHKPVQQFYEALRQFKTLGVSNEGAVRSAFQNLLEHCWRHT